MKSELNYCKYADCNECIKVTDLKFRRIEIMKGEKFFFEVVDTYAIAFILEGEFQVSCDNFVRKSLRFQEIAFWSTGLNCVCEAIADTTAIIFTGNNAMTFCDKLYLPGHSGNSLKSPSHGCKNLSAKARLIEFFRSVENYLNDGIACPYIYECKEWELALLLKAYYSREELMDFFLPLLCRNQEFVSFVMNNYLKMKGVKEFVDLSGMNLSAFNRKFKTHFGESPYQWLIKQRSKHIYHALAFTNKSFASIAKEFYFTDASHFNHYCKSMFGNSPSKIRENMSGKSNSA